MRKLEGWVRRHRVVASFAAGALLTLLTVVVVGYFVLADQRRSARVLAAALTQALARQVRIDRVTELNPSRVVMKGVRLSAKEGWPADVVAETVEASGPLLAAARGEAAPVRLQVTRPTVASGAGAGPGAAAFEGLRQGLATLLGTSALIDVGVTDGALETPGSPSGGVAFDGTLHKGSGEARGELLLRDGARSRFVLRLEARTEGDTVRLALGGEGTLAPLSPWLPATMVRAAGSAPADVQIEVGLDPGDRLAGHLRSRLGDLATLGGAVSFREGLLRLTELEGAADLKLAVAVAGFADPVSGRVELGGGEVSWSSATGGWPSAQGDLRAAEIMLPASLAGADVRVRGVETRLALEPREGRAVARGELRGERVEAAGVEVAPLATSWLVDLAPGARVVRAELSGLTAQVLGVPVRGTVTHDPVRARTDARLETPATPLDPLVRRLGSDWLGPSDRLQAGSIRVVATDLDLRGWSAGKVDTEIRELALRQPDGDTRVSRARVSAIAQSGGAAVTLEAEQVEGSAPHLQGVLARVEGSADVVRVGGGAGLVRGALVTRDAQGREMLTADLERPSAGVAGPVRLTARMPALERLAPLWPSLKRQVTGSASVELESPDVGFGTYQGRLTLKVPEASLLNGRLSLRDLSAEVPLRRGGPAVAAGPPGEAIAIEEFIGYGVVLYDLSGRARLDDRRLVLDGLGYGLYSGRGHGTVELTLAADGPSAHARLSGEGVRVEEFMAAYGVRGGTMTGLLRYDLDVRYLGGRLAADGQMSVPEGGTVTIELLDRFLSYAEADPSGVVKRALGNLRAFDFKAAESTVRTASDDIRVSLSMQGRERFGIFPPRVKEINVRDMPLGFLARQFPVH